MLEDMCEKEEFGDIDYDRVYFDENTWEALNPRLVGEAEKEEMSRLRKMQVYSYRPRWEALQDKGGKFVKVKWVRINKGSPEKPNIRCRLVAQELGYSTLR